jgi:hypothetical protein
LSSEQTHTILTRHRLTESDTGLNLWVTGGELMSFTVLRNVAVSIMVALTIASTNAEAKRNCNAVGGMLMTNLGAVDAATTMGVATGDLRGAVGATILNTDVQNGGATLVFTVQHHWVTESGDTLSFSNAKAIVNQVAHNSTRYGVVSYAVHLNGGTGQFANLTGDLDIIGEADLATGQLVFRYTGSVCPTERD